jgi:trehalose synthase
MLQRVRTSPLALSAYNAYLHRALTAKIEALAEPLRGLRVVHINATPDGGGVAEILRSLVPLSRSVGVDARWYVLPPDDTFFEVTKRFHNWLQGHPGRVTTPHKRTYLEYLTRLAAQMGNLRADVWVVHDPQPLPLRTLVPLEGAAVWRCHIDCSTPNGHLPGYLLPWVRSYDRAIFSMPEYVLPGLPPEMVRVQYPAIDPLSAKNRPLRRGEARNILSALGIDPRRPLVTQVSRFDPWKNPWEAVDAYRLAKREIPDLQLALVGVFSAKDDPESPRVFRSIQRQARGDPDIQLFTDPLVVGQREVNAFQGGSTVLLQRSVREGFGLTVTEAMWKGRPVVATCAGGIKVQIQDGKTGFLVETAEACAERIVQLVRDPRLANAVGAAAHRAVRGRFLLPRLLLDDLRLFGELVSKRPGSSLVA